jgi:hypothetical protein
MFTVVPPALTEKLHWWASASKGTMPTPKDKMRIVIIIFIGKMIPVNAIYPPPLHNLKFLTLKKVKNIFLIFHMVSLNGFW